MKSINDKINARIKELQKERNWSTNHLAVEAGISSSTIINWYARKATPSIKAIDSLCVAFGITKSQFFYEGKEPIEFTVQQQELLSEWDLLHNEQKIRILELIKSINKSIKTSNPL